MSNNSLFLPFKWANGRIYSNFEAMLGGGRFFDENAHFSKVRHCRREHHTNHNCASGPIRSFVFFFLCLFLSSDVIFTTIVYTLCRHKIPKIMWRQPWWRWVWGNKFRMWLAKRGNYGFREHWVGNTTLHYNIADGVRNWLTACDATDETNTSYSM